MDAPRSCPGQPVAVASLVLLMTVGCAMASPIELRFTPRVGEETKHRLLISARVEVFGDGGSSHWQTSKALVRIDYVRRVLSETDAAAMVETRQLEGTATLSAGNDEGTIDLGLLHTVTPVDRRRRAGDVAEPKGVEPPDPDQVPEAACGILLTLGIGCGMWTSLVDMLELPEDPVEVGATWSRRLPATDDRDPWAFDYKLEEVTTHSGRNCAKIRVEWHNRYALMERPEYVDGPPVCRVEGVHSGHMLWYYDYEKSVDVQVEGTACHETKQLGRGVNEKALQNFKITLLE